MRILHVFRSPVGGLFRHVRDLAKGQHGLGHEVGLFCDSTTGGPQASKVLADCATFCSAGVVTEAISRLPSPGDLAAIRKAIAMARQGGFDIIHGHGAKGGLIARLAGKQLGTPSLYTPHGGSLHYRWKSLSGAAFLATETYLARVGSVSSLSATSRSTPSPPKSASPTSHPSWPTMVCGRRNSRLPNPSLPPPTLSSSVKSVTSRASICCFRPSPPFRG